MAVALDKLDFDAIAKRDRGRYKGGWAILLVASLVSLLTHRLNSIRDILLLVGIGVAKR